MVLYQSPDYAFWSLRGIRHQYQRTAYLKALARGEGRVDLTGADVDSDIPQAIRAQARQEIARRQALKTGTAGTGKVAQANRTAAAVLSRLAKAFPQTFFLDPKSVRPLKVFLYRDLLRLEKAGALPAGIDRAALKAFLRWYGKRETLVANSFWTQVAGALTAAAQ